MKACSAVVANGCSTLNLVRGALRLRAVYFCLLLLISAAPAPVGRTAEGGVLPVAAVYTYSRSQGLFAGASLEGTVLVAQRDKNANYYGRSVTPEQILRGRVPAPPSARPLISALSRY